MSESRLPKSSIASRWLALALLFFLAPLLYGEHPNIERGVKAGRTYDFLGLDNVNLFNGNLNIAIPLGLRYPNGGGMSYGLTLTYNSKSWDHQLRVVDRISTAPEDWINITAGSVSTIQCDNYFIGDFLGTGQNWPVFCGNGYQFSIDSPLAVLALPQEKVYYDLPYPSRRSNAGQGWSVSLGALYAGSSLDNRETYADDASIPAPRSVPPPIIYVSPDGGEHVLSGAGEPGAAVVDDIRLRLHYENQNRLQDDAVIDFPDGSHRRFENRGTALDPVYRIIEITDAFGNAVKVSYPPDNETTDVGHKWVITDAFGRQQIITFQDSPQPNIPRIVSTIVLRAFGSTTATYQFNYENQSIARGTEPMLEMEGKSVVPLLRSVTSPDGSTFGFEYEQNAWDTSGLLRRMSLPTGGSIEWTYQRYQMPTDDCSRQFMNFTTGVHERTLVDGATRQTWTYEQRLPRLATNNVSSCPCPRPSDPLPGNTPHKLWIIRSPNNPESVVTVKLPSKDEITHYFSTWPLTPYQDCNVTDARASEYGLPFVRRAKDPTGDRYLSTETREYNAATGKLDLKQTVYVGYESDDPTGMGRDAHWRVKSQRTVDEAGHSAIVEYSDYDGAGHHRVQKITDGDDATISRTTTTNFTPNFERWLLNTYDFVDIRELPAKIVPGGGSTAFPGETKTLYCFDPATGALRSTRRLANLASTGDHDVLTVFDYDAAPQDITRGNVTSERWFGGDLDPVDTTACPPNPTALARYLVNYTYQFGAQSSATYVDPRSTDHEFPMFKANIDLGTGLTASSEDPALVARGNAWTFFMYDTMGRLKSVTPPDAAKTIYTYTNAFRVFTTFTPARVLEQQLSRSGSGVLSSAMFEFDTLGRLSLETVPTATGGVAVRRTKYDGAGRVASTSVLQDPGEPEHATKYSDYDVFNRPRTVVAPDGTTTSVKYLGDRSVSHTVSIGALLSSGSAVVPNSFTTEETYDVFGRLTSVREPLGTGSKPETRYSYDVENHLSLVTSWTGSVQEAQQRMFLYDARGFLLKSRVPEKGAAAAGDVLYDGYDAKGHVTAVNDGGNQIRYAFDPAERLRTVSLGSLPIKEYEFDSISDRYGVPNSPRYDRQGRLLKSVRHNRLTPGRDDLVTQYFDYDGKDGALSGKTTVIQSNGTTVKFKHSLTADELGEITRIDYPSCEGCASSGPAIPARSVEQMFSNGFLTGVKGFTLPSAPMTYASNGMLTSVTHSNGVVDRYEPDSISGLPRPASISFLGQTACIAPTLLSTPVQPLMVMPGMSATLTVIPGGTGPFTATWYRGQSPDLPSSVPYRTGLSIPTPQLNASEPYWVRVANACGTITSNAINVTVGTAISSCESPIITASPVATSMVSGGNAPLTVKADGTDLHYQWYRGNSGDTSAPIAGETRASVLVSPSVTTSYWVRVSNSCGAGMSATATVTVGSCASPQPALVASALSLRTGQSLTLTTNTVAGATYQWWKIKQYGYIGSETLIDGATTATLTLWPTSNMT